MRARALLLAAFGAAAAGAAIAAGCAAVLGVDDVQYGATSSTGDGAPADGTAGDGPTDAAPSGDVVPSSGDACTATASLLFANFDQGSTTTGYLGGGQIAAVLTEFPYVGALTVDSDASVTPPGSLVASGGNVFVYRVLPPDWLTGGLVLEGDFRVETNVEAGTTQAQLMALYLVPSEAGVGDPRGTNASLTALVMPTYVQLRLLVAGGDGGDVPVDVARTSLGTWVHARLALAPTNRGDFDVTLDVDGQRTPGAIRLAGNATSYVGWGANRRDFGEWRVRVDNACIHH